MIEGYKNGDINDKLTGGKVESFLTESKIDVKTRDDLQETFSSPSCRIPLVTSKPGFTAWGRMRPFRLRWVYFKGTNLDEKQKVELRSRVLSPDKVEA